MNRVKIKMIYHVYDQITKNEYYVNCSEKQLNSIGIREREGRFLPSLYEDKQKLTSVESEKVLSFNSFQKIVSLLRT